MGSLTFTCSVCESHNTINSNKIYQVTTLENGKRVTYDAIDCSYCKHQALLGKRILDYKEQPDSNMFDETFIRDAVERHIPKRLVDNYYCPNCGSSAFLDDRFCRKCGQAIITN